jgi:hypothetical protein
MKNSLDKSLKDTLSMDGTARADAHHSDLGSIPARPFAWVTLKGTDPTADARKSGHTLSPANKGNRRGKDSAICLTPSHSPPSPFPPLPRDKRRESILPTYPEDKGTDSPLYTHLAIGLCSAQSQVPPYDRAAVTGAGGLRGGIARGQGGRGVRARVTKGIRPAPRPPRQENSPPCVSCA